MDAIDALRQAAQQINEARKQGIDVASEPPHRAHKIISPEDRIKPKQQKPTVKKSYKVTEISEDSVNSPLNNQVPGRVVPPSSVPKLTEDMYDTMFFKPTNNEDSQFDAKNISEKYNMAHQQMQTEQIPNTDVPQMQPIDVQSQVHESVIQEPVFRPDVDKQAIQESRFNQPMQTGTLLTTPVYTDDEFVVMDEIPSENRFYQSKPLAQPLKLKDLLIIENLSDDNVFESFNEIFHRRVKGIDPLDILSSDETYILQYLRASTFPQDPYTWQYFKCKKCKHEINDPGYKIDFNNMLFKNNNGPSAIFEKHKDYGFCPVKVGNSYFQVYLRRRRHDLLYRNKVNMLKSSGESVDKPYLALLNLAIITEIDGCNSLDAKIERIGNLTKDEAIEFISGIEQGTLKTTVEVVHTCPACGGQTVTPFPFRFKTFISSVQIKKFTGK